MRKRHLFLFLAISVWLASVAGVYSVQEDYVPEIDPHSAYLSDAFLSLFERFHQLSLPDRVDRERRVVGLSVETTPGPGITELSRLSRKKIAHDAAYALSQEMGYVQLRVLDEPLMEELLPDGSVTAAMKAKGLENYIRIVVERGEEQNRIAAAFFDRSFLGVASEEEVEVPKQDFAGTTVPYWIPIAVLVVLGIVAVPLVLYPLVIRGYGSLLVEAEYEEDVEEVYFSILISPKQLGPPLKRGGELSYVETIKEQGRQKSKYAASIVGKRTHFNDLPARFYNVYFYGVLMAHGEPIGSYSLSHRVRVIRGEMEHAVFDLQRKTASVDVVPLLNGTYCPGPEVWFDANRSASLFAKDAGAQGTEGVSLTIPKGEHVVHVCYKGRTVSRPVVIDKPATQVVYVDIDDADLEHAAGDREV